MNENLQQLLEKLNDGLDLVSGEIPDIVKEILKYNSFICYLYHFVSTFILGFCIIFISIDFNDREFNVIKYFLGFVLGLGAIICNFAAFIDLMKIKMAPRLYLIETVRHLIKGCD